MDREGEVCVSRRLLGSRVALLKALQRLPADRVSARAEGRRRGRGLPAGRAGGGASRGARRAARPRLAAAAAVAAAAVAVARAGRSPLSAALLLRSFRSPRPGSDTWQCSSRKLECLGGGPGEAGLAGGARVRATRGAVRRSGSRAPSAWRAGSAGAGAALRAETRPRHGRADLARGLPLPAPRGCLWVHPERGRADLRRSSETFPVAARGSWQGASGFAAAR